VYKRTIFYNTFVRAEQFFGTEVDIAGPLSTLADAYSFFRYGNFLSTRLLSFVTICIYLRGVYQLQL
jgi:hypothetical protein